VQFRARRLDNAELSGLLDTFSRRVVRVLDYRMAIGPHAARKALVLYSLPPLEENLSYCFYY
jgi:hypothetical protein